MQGSVFLTATFTSRYGLRQRTAPGPVMGDLPTITRESNDMARGAATLG